MLQILLNSIPMRVFWKDTHSKFLGSNQIFLEDLGIGTLDGLVGKSDYDFIADTQECENFIKDDQELMRSGLAKIGIEEPQSVNGEGTRWLRTNKVPLTDKGGQVIGLLGTYEDITEQVKYREEIEKQALIDSLTQLPNRHHLQNSITSFNGECAGLLFIDLDYFKVVNDSLGHSVGDTLLQQVAERINAIIPDEKGLVARLGGDEFSVFVPLVSESEYKLVMADFAQQIVDTFINMSKNLHMEVIAEGVETSEERDELIGLGCSQFQGYLLSRPVTSNVFITTILKG
ncbi:MAG: diguanylate cyclase (GGDEF)-like protein [Glaciecola sp.]